MKNLRIILVIILTIVLFSCQKQEYAEPIEWTIETNTEFCWIFYHVNSDKETMLPVYDYMQLLFIDNINDTIEFIATGKVPIEITVKRNNETIIKRYIEAFKRDTIEIITY